MSQSSVLSIYQDYKGFIWLGTRDGLNRFDGISFKVFKNNPNDKFSIENNYIKKIKEAPDSTLYIGTNKGLSYFKRETNQFIKLVDTDEKLDNVEVWDFVFQENTIWIGTDEGLISYDKDKKSLPNTSSISIQMEQHMSGVYC